MMPLVALHIAQVPSASTGYGWTGLPWGNSSSYYATRVKVESDFARKPDLATFVGRWRRLGLTRGLPAEVRFGYGVAMVIVCVEQGKRIGFEKDVANAIELVSAPDVPANFETARARYLLERSVWPSPKAWPIAERLLRRDPNDPSVRYFGSVDMACGAPDVETRLRGLAIARDLARSADRYPRRLRALAAANEGVWNLNKDPARLDDAIAAWRRLSESLAPNDPGRKPIEDTIRFLTAKRRRPT